MTHQRKRENAATQGDDDEDSRTYSESDEDSGFEEEQKGSEICYTMQETHAIRQVMATIEFGKEVRFLPPHCSACPLCVLQRTSVGVYSTLRGERPAVCHATNTAI